MKKWLVLLIITALVGTIYYLVVSYVEYTPSWLAGQKTKVERGDIRSPITSSGRIQPKKYIEIKSEASGEVMHLLVEEGDFVSKGQTMVVLDPNDETRSVDIASLQLQDTKTQLKIAKEQARRSEGAGIQRADANVLAAQADWDDARSRLKKIEALPTDSRIETEVERYQAATDAAQARHDAAEAALAVANSDAKLSKYQAELAEKAVERAQTNLNDAEERLRETVIKAPNDAMVARVTIQVGTLVQSGTKSLTGGTQLIKLADTSELYVIAMVDDADFGLVRRIAPPSARPQMRPGPRRQSGAMQPASLPTTQANPGTHPATLPALPVDPTKRVKVMVDTFPDEEFWGVIERIDPEGEVHGAIVQYRVHVRLTGENAYEMLQLGLPAQVEFTAENRKGVLKVESRAIRKKGDQYGVYVPAPTQDDKLATRFVPIRIGITDGTYTEILPGSGLKDGQVIYREPPPPPKDRGK